MTSTVTKWRDQGREAKNQRRGGQAGLFVVVSLTLTFAVLGFAVDLGWAYFRRNAAQAAADASALAAAIYASNNGYTCGSNGVVCGAAAACANPPTTPPTTDLQAGCLYAQANGFVNGGNQTVSLTANNSGTPPPGVAGNTPAYWVQANISETLTNMFSVFGLHTKTATLNVSSTASVAVTPPAGCIYVLSSNASPALRMTGSASATSSCGVFINSNGKPALSLTGSSHLDATFTDINSGTYSTTGSAVISPTPNTSGGSVSDPLATLAEPSVGGCDYTNYSISGSGTTTISPGVYCGGISISGSGTVIFNSGMYILNGGGFSKAGSGTLTGSGLTFFNTGQNGYTASGISMSGSATVTFSAPTDGTYQGILFLQDRNVTYAGGNTVTGSTSSSYTGTLYFPTTDLTYTGSSSGTYSAIIAKTLTMVGSSVIKNDPTGVHTGLEQKSTAIIQ